MKEIHNGGEVEPKFQTLTEESLRHSTANTDPDARADIRVRGACGKWALIRNLKLTFLQRMSSFAGKGLLKKLLESRTCSNTTQVLQYAGYNHRLIPFLVLIKVEHGSFTPLVFSTCGGMGQEASVVIKKLADALATKRNESYSRVAGWMRCCLAFLMAR